MKQVLDTYNALYGTVSAPIPADGDDTTWDEREIPGELTTKERLARLEQEIEQQGRLLDEVAKNISIMAIALQTDYIKMDLAALQKRLDEYEGEL